MDLTLSRRVVVRCVAALAATPVMLVMSPSHVWAAPEDMQAAIQRLTAGVDVQPGRVKIEIPPLSENGNTVPVTVTVESPMTAQDHVKAIHIFNERNPQPHVLSAWLGPRAGQATLQTRVRLSDTQNIVAIAHMSDGRFWSDTANVIVTLGACLEEPI